MTFELQFRDGSTHVMSVPAHLGEGMLDDILKNPAIVEARITIGE